MKVQIRLEDVVKLAEIGLYHLTKGKKLNDCMLDDSKAVRWIGYLPNDDDLLDCAYGPPDEDGMRLGKGIVLLEKEVDGLRYHGTYGGNDSGRPHQG